MSASPHPDATPPSSRMFLFTDIEDSTRLWQSAPEVMQSALARHDAIMRDGIAAHGGEVFKTAGDAFYAAFPDPPRGLDAALALQQALGDEPWPAATPIRVRMALHVGEALPRDGDWFGPPLNVVARMLTVTRGAQTLVSAAAKSCLDGSRAGAASTLGGAGAGAAVLESHGYFRMKGVDEPVEVFELGLRGTSAFLPPRDTDPVYRVVRDGDLWQPARAVRNNLPAERDAFVGRVAELQAIARRLDDGERLVTLLGPAGTGKTRIACRYGRVWLGDWPGGVYFCDLSEARTLDGIHFAVASALEVALGQGDATQQLGHAIAGRGRCLVILDNFEQVAQHGEATVGRWLGRAGDAAFLVTSRERLHVAGEEVLPVEPLPLDGDAIELFAARARAQSPGFVLSDGNRGAVAEVVRLVDGLPLAIELAAARVRVFSPEELVRRMRDRFALLAGARGAAARQATLKAAIDWSWDLLAPWEQAAFAQCSVFEGGFAMDAAEAVIDLAGYPEAPPAMDAVQALVDKSLLRVWQPAAQRRYDVDEPYFGMYLSIHEYAGARLEAAGADAVRAAQERHGDFFARFGGDAAIDALFRHGGVRRRHALVLELDNLVAACRRALERDADAVAVATFRAAWEVLELRGPFAVAAALGAQVRARPALGPGLRALALRTQGRILWKQGRFDEAKAALGEAVALAREAGDRAGEGIAIGTLGVVASDQGYDDETEAMLQAALAIHREVGNRRAEAIVLSNLASLRSEQGRIDEALVLAKQAIGIHREIGNRLHEAMVLANTGILEADRGALEEARRLYEEAIAIQREVGSRASEGNTRGNLGNLLRQVDRAEEAQVHLEAALAIARETGDRRREGIALGNLAGVYADRGDLATAEAQQVAALAIHREVHNRRFVGIVQSGLALTRHRQGRFDEAAAAAAEGEAVLREIGDRVSLVSMLCIRGRNDLACGREAAARDALDEAGAIAREVGAEPDSAMACDIAALRDLLEADKMAASLPPASRP